MSIPKSSLYMTLYAAALALCPACGSDNIGSHVQDGTSAEGHSDGGHTNAMGDEAAVADADVVPCGDDYPGVMEGMTTQVGDLTVKLVSAELMPARQHVDNDWVLEVSDAAGQPVSDFEVANPRAYMSVHNHYGVPEPTVEEVAEPGQFKLDNIRFRMRGPWEVMFQLAQGEAQEMASIQICVE